MKRVLATILSLVMVLGTIVIFPVSAAEAITPDTSWYTEHTSDKEYTISTPAELLGLNQLIHTNYNFSGKTVKLGADIDLNADWKASSSTAPTNVFTVANVGGDAWSHFAGTLDGQNHTVKGIYATGTSTNYGLIAGCSNSAKVKNITFENCYVNATSTAGGLFGYTNGTSVIENVTMKDVYVTSTKGTVGGIAGSLQGTSTVKNVQILGGSISAGGSNIGGVAGEAKGTITVENVVMDANVQTSKVIGWPDMGGIIGACSTPDSVITVKNCVISGDLINNRTASTKDDRDAIGGVIGMSNANNMTIDIENCLVCGTIGNNLTIAGGIMARCSVNNDTPSINLTIKNCIFGGVLNGSATYASIIPQYYAQNSANNAAISGKLNFQIDKNLYLGTKACTGTASSLSTASVTKATAFSYNTLYTDATTVLAGAGLEGWTVIAGSYPMPTALYNVVGSMVFTKPVGADTSWYSDDKTEFNLTNADQFLGFNALLHQNKNFSGKTIKITADIDLNPGWTAGESATAPANVLSTRNTSDSWSHFAGTIDGQGHTIKGLYVTNATSGSDYIGWIAGSSNGSTVKNITFDNCMTVAYTNKCGGLFGYANGTNTITNVTISNSYLCTSAQMLGGIAGAVTAGTTTVDGCVVKNCIVKTGASGRASAIIGQAEGSSTVTIKNTKVLGGTLYESATATHQGNGTILGCAHTGTFTIENVYSSMNIEHGGTATGDIAAGGFVGMLWNGSTLTIKNSVYAGTINVGGARSAAGFLAYADCGTFNANHCSFIGTINGTNSLYGAIFGRADGNKAGVTMNIQNCVNNGTLPTTGGKGIIAQSFDDTDTVHNLTIKNNFSVVNDGSYITLTNASSQKDYVAPTIIPATMTANALYTNNMDGFSIVDGKVYPSAMAMEMENAPVDFVGYQTKAGTSTVDVRLVGTVDDLWYDAVGFDVTLTLNGTTKTVSQNVTNVYSSIIAEGEGDERDVLTASTLGGAYLFALNLTNLPNNADLTITVTPYFVRNGVKVAGNSVTLTGVNTAKNSVNG